MSNRNNQKSRRANSSSSSSSAPPAQEFVSSLPQRSRRAALNHSNQNPQQASQLNIRQEDPQLIGDDLQNFPALSREELEAQRRSYRALSTATPQRNASEVRALRHQLETAERANGLVAHQQHIHGPCPPEFLSSRYLPQAVADELEQRWMESERLLDARIEQKFQEDPDLQPSISSTSGVLATPNPTTTSQATMTVQPHGLSTNITSSIDAPTGIVDALQGTDNSAVSETPRFSSADPEVQGSGPLAVGAGQETQRPPQQVSERHLGGNTNPSVDSTSPPLSKYPQPRGPRNSHSNSSLAHLDVIQPPPPQKRMLPTLIGGVSVYNDGCLHVPLHDLHGSHTPLRDYPMTPPYVNPPITLVTRTSSRTPLVTAENNTIAPHTSTPTFMCARQPPGPASAGREYRMTPLAVNPRLTHLTRIADTTQPSLTRSIVFPPLSSELLLGFVNELSGPLTAVRGYPMTLGLINLDTFNRP